jgi:hypothetical protein
MSRRAHTSQHVRTALLEVDPTAVNKLDRLKPVSRPKSSIDPPRESQGRVHPHFSMYNAEQNKHWKDRRRNDSAKASRCGQQEGSAQSMTLPTAVQAPGYTSGVQTRVPCRDALHPCT